MKKRRLDEILQERGVIKNKQEAFVIVTEGRVFVNGQKAISPAQFVGVDAKVEVKNADGYVGRGAYKLEAALAEFGINAAGKICADIGAATGGFTEVLLRRGAEKVYAIDTARGKLALKIRQDSRVVVMEQTDVRHLNALPDPIDIAVIDVSLISLRDILGSVRRLLAPSGAVAALFKPQYETRDAKILHHGVIRDPLEREKLAADFQEWAAKNNWEIKGKIEL
ncbi:MAG: TlyA family RNA methyltransferase, partial [Candidatus Sungiibacteriota bacterium]